MGADGAIPRLVSVQAWHWIAPDVRYELAHASLVADGTLAAVWTFPIGPPAICATR